MMSRLWTSMVMRATSEPRISFVSSPRTSPHSALSHSTFWSYLPPASESHVRVTRPTHTSESYVRVTRPSHTSESHVLVTSELHIQPMV